MQAYHAGEYKIQSQYCPGAQGKVFLGRLNHQLYALKIYKNEEEFRTQQQMYAQIDCKYIIRMIQSNPSAQIHIADDLRTHAPLIVLPSAQFGDLLKFIPPGKGLPQLVCKRIFKQILSGIEYLNARMICHIDIKPENIFVNSSFQIKIGDLGKAFFHGGNYITTSDGTKQYSLFQMVEGKPFKGLHADLYAAGITLFTILGGNYPYENSTLRDIAYRALKDKRFEDFWNRHQLRANRSFPPAVKRLISSLLSPLPDDRPSIEQLNNNEWLAGEQINDQEFIKVMNTRYNQYVDRERQQKKKAYLWRKNLQHLIIEGLSPIDTRSETVFLKQLKEIKINKQNLPVKIIFGVEYAMEDPVFVVALIHSFLIRKTEKNNIFLEDIKIISSEFTQNNDQIKISVKVMLDEETEQIIVVKGNLHRNNKENNSKVGVWWEGIEGNNFRIKRLIETLNNCLACQVQKQI